MEVQFFYRKDSKQIDAVFRDCKTNSAVFKDQNKDQNIYAEVNVTDSTYIIGRDYKVVLQDSEVINTVPSVNPIQPVHEPNPYQDCIDLISEPTWGSGVPAKIEIIRTVLLRLLGAK